MSHYMTQFNLQFDPLLPWWCLIILGLFVLLILGFSLLQKSYKGLIWRLLASVTLIIWLSGPIILKSQQEILPETILVVADQSESMDIHQRLDIEKQVLEHLNQHLPTNIHTKIITVRNDKQQGTNLFEAIQKAAYDIPNNQLGGIVIITDGQIHDVPSELPKSITLNNQKTVPIYALLPASHEEKDRHLTLLHSPSYGLVGKDAIIKLQVNDTGISASKDHQAELTITYDNQQPTTINVPIGSPQEIRIPITHTGNTFVGLSVSPLKGEVSQINNYQILSIHGVKDKLKVLLISSKPNQGERAWRSLLKSDPSVDLVHFTILRTPEQDDYLPASELALVPFPVNDLFMRKIGLFDLIILDGFENRYTLPSAYIANIASYVRNGGGLLLVAGPEFAEQFSLQNSPLGSILPATVNSEKDIINKPFQPQLTSLGKQHPITKNLAQNADHWGPWYRYLKANQIDGHTIMETPDHSPLLMLNHIDSGRIALLLSDQIWLWSKGEKGGGPHAELLRRLSHWLMKEPELEEQNLTASIQNHQLKVEWTNVLNHQSANFIVTAPSGKAKTITLTPDKNGYSQTILPVNEDGIWKISHGSIITYAAAQYRDPIEISDLAVTDKKLNQMISKTKGRIYWLGDHPNNLDIPTIRLTNNHHINSDKNTMEFPQLIGYNTTQQTVQRLFPAWIALIIGLGNLLLAWYRESTA